MNVKLPTATESITNRTMLAVDKLQKLSCRWLTSNEQELVNRANNQSSKNADAAILYFLHTEYGFTAEQLTEFFNKFNEKYGGMETNFQAAVEDIPEVKSLLDIGFDINKYYEGLNWTITETDS